MSREWFVEQELLELYNMDRIFLGRIATEDEIWIHHYEPERKKEKYQWNHPDSPINKTFKAALSAGKVIVIMIWR